MKILRNAIMCSWLLSLSLYLQLFILSTKASTFDPNNQLYYPINPLHAYTWYSSFPPSCSCVETGATNSNCDYFVCDCVCDITANQCDYGCCCDPDCSQSQIDRFALLDSCAYQGSNGNNQFCFSNEGIQSTNNLDVSTTQKAVDQALCINTVNLADKNFYYVDTDIQDSTIFTSSEGQKQYSYIEITPSTHPNVFYYDQNDTITVYRVSNKSQLVTSVIKGSNWNIPMKDFTGFCNDNNLVRFEVDISRSSPNGQCLRIIPSDLKTFSEYCNGIWSLDYYVKHLFIDTKAPPTKDTIIPVTLNSIVFRDYSSGEIIALNSHTSSLNETILLSNACESVVQAVSYKIIHDATDIGTIKQVLADVVITNISLSNAAGTFSQEFSVYFHSLFSGKPLNENELVFNNDTFPRPRSGNPGYLIGKPIVSGSKLISDEETVIHEDIYGLTYLSPSINFDPSDPASFGKSLCPTQSTMHLVNQEQILFGFDVTSGCVLKLSKSELESLCCQASSQCIAPSISPYSSVLTGIPYFFNISNSDFIGIYGNADPLDISQWLKVSTPSIDKKPSSWNNYDGTCSNMFTGLHYNFLITKSGEISNPQNKIISSSVEITTSDLIYLSPINTTKQSFQLSVTVSFIFKDPENLVGYVVPPPPNQIAAPYDAFYPFQVSAGSSSFSKTSNLSISIIVSFFTLLLLAVVNY